MARTLGFVGWYGRHNAGDEAFKAVHDLLFPDIPRRWISRRSEAGDPAETLYVLGGGDVFLDYYLDMIPEGAPFFAYGVGLASPRQYEAVAQQRERLLGIWVRNPGDAEALRALGVEAHYTPDIALLLGEAVAARPPHPALAGRTRKRLVFCPSGNADQTALQRGDLADHFYMNYFKIALARALDELSEFYDIVMLPLSHDYKDFDAGFVGQVHGLMKRPGRVIPITEELPPLDVARVIADCQLCVSMKFHGLVFAALAGVPFVNIGFTRKTAEFCADLGQPGLAIEPYAFTHDAMRRAVKLAEAPATAEALREAVAGRVAEAQQAAAQFREQVLAAL
jgi:polysaccharide pyruvyl transferase WcaK-like protein